METMGDRIKQLLQAQGISQAELARRVGVTRAAVQKWISGDTANMENAALLLTARELHTDAAYLVWGPDRKPAGTTTTPAATQDSAATGRFRVGGPRRT
jgi:transcriptional regulator with XRE-family HTH domain